MLINVCSWTSSYLTTVDFDCSSYIVFLFALFRPWTLLKQGILHKFQANILNYHTHTTFTPDPKSSLSREWITFSMHCCLLLGNWNNNEASTFVSFHWALEKWKLLFLLHCIIEIQGGAGNRHSPTHTKSKTFLWSLVFVFVLTLKVVIVHKLHIQAKHSFGLKLVYLDVSPSDQSVSTVIRWFSTAWMAFSCVVDSISVFPVNEIRK